MTMSMARERISTPMAFLAEQEQLQFEWPASDEKTDWPQWKMTAPIIQDKTKLTIRFTTEHRKRLREDSQLYFELCEATSLAMNIHAAAVRLTLKGKFMSPEKFRMTASAIRCHCDTLKGSIKTIFSLLDEGDLTGRVDRAM